jgi:hypothetical protein
VGAVAARAIVVAVVLSGLTLWQQHRFRNDRALWAAAVAVNHTSPRPALNYAIALRKAGQPEAAAPWLVAAGARAVGNRHERHYRALVAEQVMLLEITGFPVCHLPAYRPYC